MGNSFHRSNGQFGTGWEKQAYEGGLAAGIARGIAIGVAMAAKAVGMSLVLMWSLIRGGNKRDAA